MFFQTATAILGFATVAIAQSSTSTTLPNTATDTAAVASELATTIPLSPVSHVKGKVFDRIAVIMMENIDLTAAMENPNMSLLAEKGITLTNYFGTTHPSEPNYAAIHGGDHFGMDNDAFHQIPANVSTLFDILAEKDISFGEYQEDLPYAGFEGFAYLDPITGANNYVRKHNPAVLYNKNVQDQTYLDTIIGFEEFYSDMEANTMPQYMYITPNMLNDAHDTGIVYGADWLYQFLEPILANENFMNNTLLVINFDECETYTIGNRVMSILISDTMPTSLVNTTDDTFYTHYSIISTIEANWDLSHLGRWDTHANVLKYVANTTGDVIRTPETLDNVFFNQSYPGAFATSYWGPMPAPNISAVVNGRSVFSEVAEQWSDLQDCTYYTDQIVPADGLRLPKALPVSCWSASPKPLSTSTTTTSTSTPSAVSVGTTSTFSATSVLYANSTSGAATTSIVYETSTSVVYATSIVYVTSDIILSTTICPASSSASPPVPTSTAYTTSTFYSTYTSSTVSGTSTGLTTVTIAISTTVCPVTETKTSIPAMSSTEKAESTTSTIYATSVYTITSCAASVTDCPARVGSVTTETIALYTSVCPVTEAQGISSASIASASISPVVVSSTTPAVVLSSLPVAIVASGTPAPFISISTSTSSVAAFIPGTPAPLISISTTALISGTPAPIISVSSSAPGFASTTAFVYGTPAPIISVSSFSGTVSISINGTFTPSTTSSVFTGAGVMTSVRSWSSVLALVLAGIWGVVL